MAVPVIARRCGPASLLDEAGALWAALAFTVAFNAAFAVWILIAPASPTVVAAVDDLLQGAGPLMMSVFCVATMARGISPRGLRGLSWRNGLVAPLLLVSCTACFGVGQVLWTYYEQVLHTPPFPSWADALFLIADVSLLLGILGLSVGTRSVALRARILLNGLLLMTALVTFSWYFVLGPTMLLGGDSFFAKIIGTAYPVFDLVVVATLQMLAARSRHHPLLQIVVPLFVAEGFIVVTDSIFDFQQLHGTYFTGHIMDVGWPLGYMLIGVAALQASRYLRAETAAPVVPFDESVDPESWRKGLHALTEMLPYGLIPLLGALLVFASRQRDTGLLEIGVWIGAGLVVALVIARQIASTLENRRLYAELQRTYEDSVAQSRRTEQLNDQLRSSEERFRTGFQYAAVGMALVDTDGNYLQVNDALCAMLGYTEQELLAQTFRSLTVPEDEGIAEAYVGLVGGEGGTMHRQEKRYQHKDGHPVWTELSVSSVLNDRGELIYHIAQVQDITQRKQAEQELRVSEERYRVLVETSPDCITLTDPQAVIIMANQRAAELFGYESPDSMIGIRAIELISREDHARATADFAHLFEHGQLRALEYRLVRRDGTTFPAEWGSSAITNADGQPIAYTNMTRDITERKSFEDRLLHQAMHDGLTGLPNRSLFNDRLNQAILQSRRSATTMALLVMDLDRFKDVNDTFGHHYGDLLLQHISWRLSETVRESDTIARMGGDEFAIVLPGANQEQARAMASRIVVALEPSFEIESQTLSIGASIGITVFPDQGLDAEVLLQHADVAMYVAKRAGSGFQVYTPEQDHNSPTRVLLTSELRHAIDRNQLVLHYQPKINLLSGAVDGIEALVRWQHPDRGMVPPDQFIHLAEHTGLIKPLSIWVVRRALSELRHVGLTGLDLCVSVNISARNLQDAHVVDAVSAALRHEGISPHRLQIEITESAIMSNPDQALEILAEFHRMGLQLAIDDFGTGYSSLAYLKRLPVHELKIDKSFIAEMSSNDNDHFIVRSVVDLGHNVGLRVVAEGVEDQPTWNLLSGMRCDLAQGFFLSRPLPMPELLKWLGWWATPRLEA